MRIVEVSFLINVNALVILVDIEIVNNGDSNIGLLSCNWSAVKY